jgi:hypothetical protein
MRRGGVRWVLESVEGKFPEQGLEKGNMKDGVWYKSVHSGVRLVLRIIMSVNRKHNMNHVS